MVGMDVGIDDEVDAHAGIVGRTQLWLNLADRVDDGSSCFAAAAEEVGDTDWILVEELAEDHELALLIAKG
jgi:hypothetical protein